MNPYLQSMISHLVAEEGVREVPRFSNGGPRVEEYLRTVGLGKGYSWCGALINWGVEKAEAEVGGGECELPWPGIKSRDCDALEAWAKASGILIIGGLPEEGDLFLVMNGEDAHHVGQVIKVRVDLKKFYTVEGNTNNNGSSNGDGVYLRERDFSSKYRFVRLAKLWDKVPVPKNEPRLIIGYARRGDKDFKYVDVSSRKYLNGFFTADGTQLRTLFPGVEFPTGRRALRELLNTTPLRIDENLTKQGNHLSDKADPRQYVFIYLP